MKETRQPFLLGLLAIASILGFSFYLQYVKDIFPCPLCEVQRLTFSLIGCFFLIGTLLHRFRFIRFVLWCFISLSSLLGVVLASKQVWIQIFPEAVKGVCGASLMQLLHMLPLSNVISQIFSGTSECTEKGWVFLYLNLAQWSLILFIVFLLFSIYSFIRECRYQK